MATATYYFNAKSSDWDTNPENMIDGSVDTDASTATNDQIQLLTGNTCDGTSLGTISKVELRAYGSISGGASQLRTTPVFGGSDDGDEHNMDYYVEGWSSYEDITSDTNAPGTWDWNDIQNLDCKAKAYINGGTAICAKVEIEVTYTAGSPPSTTGEQKIINEYYY